MPYPSKAVLIHDSTGGANASHNTGTLNVTDYDELLVELVPSAAPAASFLRFRDTDLSPTLDVATLATPTTADVKTAAWGGGVPAAASGEYVGGRPGALPPGVRFDVGALGAGVTARLRVWGRRSFRGSIARPVALDGVTPAALD
jgi:hypothetical protein